MAESPLLPGPWPPARARSGPRSAVPALFLLVATGLAAAPAAWAATYHVAQVDPTASDDNPGTAQRPWKTISRAAAGAELAPGTVVQIDSGVYRERVLIEKNGTAEKPIRFEAAPGASVVVTGADRLTEWRKEEGPERVYSTNWPHAFVGWSKTHAHPDDDAHAVIGRCEQVFVQGYALRQVLRRNHVTRGTFYVDLAAKRLYACSEDNADLTKRVVEASSRNVLWECKGDHVLVRGIRFRYAANRAQEGTAQFHGKGDAAEDCLFEWTNGIGAAFLGPDQVARRCSFLENGQMGFGASRAHRLLVTECLVRGNNTKGFDRGWEAGGNKLAFCRGVVLEKSQFLENRGHGIWFDIGNEACTVRNCLITDNEDSGIFYEISFGLHAHDNVIVGNGFAGTPGSWGAACGISLSSSPGCTVERNLIIGNREGLNFREQKRTTPRIDGGRKEEPVWNHDQVIRNNVLAYNRDAQSWGWFDVDDERHWPTAMWERTPDGNSPAREMPASRAAQGKEGEPAGLSLETLKVTFENNWYAVRGPQGLFHWGVTWKRHKKYAALDDVRRELAMERGSRCEPFLFRDYLTRDFRVAADSAALRMGCYPRGEVPGVRLGTIAP